MHFNGIPVHWHCANTARTLCQWRFQLEVPVIPKSAGVLFMYADPRRAGGAPARPTHRNNQRWPATGNSDNFKMEIPASARILLNEAASWKIYDNAIDF